MPPFRSLGLCSAAVLVLFAAPLRAQDDDSCQPYPLVAVNVNPVFEEPALDKSKNLAAIQQIAHSGSGVIPHYDIVTLGVTHYEPAIEFRAPLTARQMPDGTYCAHLDHIDATIGYRNVTVYIANELTADPCSARHVLEHEQKHVSVNRALLQEFVPLVRERLYAYFRLYGQFRSPTPEFAERLLREKATAIMSDMSRGMLEENRKRQRLVDTPEEYARNNTACNGWINGLLQRTNAGRR